MPRPGEVRVGTSGYVYPHWKGAFYPEGLPQRLWFAHYAERFGSVAINTFYRLPEPSVVEKWREQAPPGFAYAFKASRYVTHQKRLKPGGSHGTPVETFLERLAPLKERLGPVLFQLPPQMPRDVDRLRAFLKRIPHQEEVPFVFEFRHPSWRVDEVFDLLGEHGAGFCMHDFGGEPTPRAVTARTVYARFHGWREPYRRLYGPHRLTPWLGRIREWRRGGHDVHVYYNNDEKAYATRDAARLAGKLGVKRPWAVA